MSSTVWTRFRPGYHGFHFVNKFAADRIPIRVLGRTFYLDLGTIGLCGGMCFAALDYAYERKLVPRLKKPPREGDELYSYIFHRQLDSWGGPPLFLIMLKVIDWQLRPNNPRPPLGRHSLRCLTREEWKTTKSSLDADHPVTLMLIRQRDLGNPSLNHQVLAYGYKIDDQPNKRVSLYVYDPNYPEQEHQIRFNLGSEYLAPWESTGARPKLRGVFPVPYDKTRKSIACDYKSTVLYPVLSGSL